ncbi:MAG TPA: ATP-binding protein [Longilinea sp.]|nr:ATP-binding protein [Longilinea sp.]
MSGTLVSNSKSRQWNWVLIGIGFLILYVLWLFWGQTDTWERELAGSLAIGFPACLAATLALLAGNQQTATARWRLAWRWIAAGIFINLAADIVGRSLTIISPHTVLKPIFFEGVYLAASIAMGTGFILYPRILRREYGRIKLFFDTIITSVAIFTLVWLIIFQPTMQATQSFNSTSSFLIWSYPFADLFLLLLLLNLFLISQPQSQSHPFVWIALGLFARTSSDLVYATLAQTGSYTTGTAVDAGWVLNSFLLALAAYTSGDSSISQSPTLFARIASRSQTLLPLLTTLGLGWYALITRQFSGQPNALGLWVTVLLGVGLIARQGVLTGEVEYRQYASLVNSVADPTFICDRHGRLRLINPAFLTATGYGTANELLSHPLSSFLNSSEAINSAIRGPNLQPWSGELQLYRKDGSELPVFLSLRPLFPAGNNRLAIAGTAYDLSEQKRQQAALEAAHSELEQLNQQLEAKVSEKTASLTEAYDRLEEQNIALHRLDELKSDFVSLVSHELRAPLTNINGGIELLLSGKRPLPRQASGTLELVQGEIKRLTRFVETILDLSALDAGRLPLYPAPLSLHNVAITLQTQLLHLDGSERIRWEIPPDYPYLLADENALGSVLFHLLDNALKYAPTGNITISAGAQGSLGWIKVSDQGPGIAPEALPNLFERFYRSKMSDSQSVYGHGLGLYIVRRLLDAMQGTVTVENLSGGGACFTCTLPLVEGIEESNASQDHAGR